jgi:hypothetical protein
MDHDLNRAAIGVDPLEAVRFFDTSMAKDGGGKCPTCMIRLLSERLDCFRT